MILAVLFGLALAVCVQADPNNAYDPDPFSGANEVETSPVLSWSLGTHAALHRIYFGTDFADVNEADTMSFVYYGQQIRDVNTFLPGVLDSNSTYYWRIDEANTAEMESPWKGAVWNFTVNNFVSIEDMESYDEYNPIYNTWWENSNSGALLWSGIDPCDPVHSGSQSMIFDYNNTQT